MANLVIVAVPSKDDYVWRISSEKVPHMTLLFLGEQKDEETTRRIIDYVEHATRTTLRRFGMSVSYRGELGVDKADVVFFDKEFAKQVDDYRGALLSNPDIALAYQSATQFPTWTPHLTLGYPSTPAKKDPRDYPGISWVNFDRIEVWTGDFTGPGFQLTSDERMALSMSSFAGEGFDAFLAHYGVKGMRWGVRRRRGIGSEGPTGVTVKVKPGRGIVKTSGGHTHPVSDDAVRAAAVRQVAKVSSTHALTNKDLQDAITRMNLEQQFSRLTATRKGAGRLFVEKLLKDTAEQELSKISKGQQSQLVAAVMSAGRKGRHAR